MKYPDFERIANDLARQANTGDHVGTIAAIADQLRLTWNARGAADVTKLELLDTLMGSAAAGPYVKNLERVLRSLDV